MLEQTKITIYKSQINDEYRLVLDGRVLTSETSVIISEKSRDIFLEKVQDLITRLQNRIDHIKITGSL